MVPSPVQATLTICSVSNNSATIYGGGILNERDLTLLGCTVAGNTAGEDGGGVANINTSFLSDSASSADASVTNSTLYGNTSKVGGGIDNEDADLTLTNATVTGNRTTNSSSTKAAGCESLSKYGDILLDNTLIAGNFGGTTPSTTPGDVSAGIDTKSADNLIGDGDNLTGITNDAQGNQIGSARAGTVIDADVGPLADNGGLTETVALLAGSPAIDAGNTALAVDRSTQQPLTTDQRGAGFPRVLGPAVDIGAFEFGNPPGSRASLPIPRSTRGVRTTSP